MISFLPRVVYRPLSDGQAWTVLRHDGRALIVINERLDEEGRRTAEDAARASLRKRRRGPAAGVLALIGGAGAWAATKGRDALHTPIGSAVTASVLTAGVLYGVGTLDDGKLPIAEPPTVVTVQPAPTPAVTPSLRPSTRAPRTRPPTGPTGLPSVITVIRPGRSESAAEGGPRRTPHPSPSQGADGRPTTTAPEATPPRPVPSAEPTGIVAEPSTPDVPQGAVGGACGIGLDVDVDPLLGVDVCLLG